MNEISPPPPKLVNGKRLLEILFDDKSRPSVRWLKLRLAAKEIPSVKIGKLRFFSPDAVRARLKLK